MTPRMFRPALLVLWTWLIALVAGLFCVVFAAIAPNITGDSRAYELSGKRWDHSCFTHEADAALSDALAAYVAVSGVRDCGVTVAPDLRVLPALPAAPSTVAGSIGLDEAGGFVRTCTVYAVDRSDRWVMLHEVGHCLGIGHSDDRFAVMYGGSAGVDPRELQADDIAGVRAIYGAPRPLRRLAISYWLLAISGDGL